MYKIFTWDSDVRDCKYCVKAKELMAERGVEYEEIRVPTDMSVEDFKTTYPHAHTLPLIFDDHGIEIGGCAQLINKWRYDEWNSGKL